MSRQVLQMKYHPAKKEVAFIRFAAGNPVAVRNDSKLKKYMNEKGKFILQDHGNSFFEDIADAFDGEKSVHIDVVTTKNDYEDFAQMIEYYNNSSGGIEITANLLSELPDMEHTYQLVRDHGEKSVGILKHHKARFFDIPRENASVKECVKMFSLAVQKEIDSIIDKIESMADNSINLCFAGVYSAGKSALINAILGYRVLPEKIESKTARMFRIQSPKPGADVRIIFSIRDSSAELIWNQENHTFEFGEAPTENETRKTIQDTLNAHNKEKQHRQIYEVLTTLNSSKEVDAGITLFFPIPLDNERVQFTIYDTPGTDSNYGEHQQILQDALSEQTHSILIFVAAPNKTEGEGNNVLLNYLKEAERKDSRTSIDIGRSLFVINWADSIGPAERCDLQKAKIKDKSDDSFSIQLSDKKLFFTSAKVAYAARAEVNKIATKDEEFTIRQQRNTVNDEEFGRYYRQNLVAKSEYGAQRLHKLCDDALAVAEKNKDTPEVLRICSGLFALEVEIATYGEKYAAAVRAFAIIDSVDKALSTMNKAAKSFESQTQEDLNKINREIEELRKTITDSIEDAYAKHEYPKDQKLPPDVLKKLQIDSQSLQSDIVGRTIEYLDQLLKGRFFGFGKVKYKAEHKNKVIQQVTSVLNNFTRNFLKGRQQLLEQIRDAFINDIRQEINANGSISDNAKDFVLSIRPPEIKEAANLIEFGEMYDSKKRADKFLWVDTSHIDKDEFLQDVDKKLTRIATGMATDFANDFRATLASVLSVIEAEFTQNTEKYSLLMQAKLEDKNAMEQLYEKIVAAGKDLRECQDELTKVIWSVKDNG